MLIGNAMNVEIKRMPIEQKVRFVSKSIAREYVYIPEFFRRYADENAVTQLINDWQRGIEKLDREVSIEERYHVTYGNWIWMSKTVYKNIRNVMGQQGISKFERAEIDEMKKRTSLLMLLVIKVLYAISPQTAFAMVVKSLAYQFQWLTPLELIKINDREMIVKILQCQILDYEDTADLCAVSCQHTYPLWMGEQFRLKMQTKRDGQGCLKTLTILPR